MKKILFPSAADWAPYLVRPAFDTRQLEVTVQEILNTVKNKGDQALFDYTEKFDQVRLETLAVSKQEMEAATQSVSPALQQAIQTAYKNIKFFHESQLTEQPVIETMPGVKCWQKNVGIEKVGLYIPGGTAPLFSTILMLGVPAKIAGCREIVLCTPPQKDGTILPAMLYTAQLIGINRIFKVGGAQAIAALAYGTESIPPVYKIFGPGNQYVTAAKQIVNRDGLAIDMPAGPSEVLVYADESARPDFVAADLLSQAEHGVDSQVVLVTHQEAFVRKTEEALDAQLQDLPRREIARQVMAASPAFVLQSEKEAVELVNAYAPEHLILAVKKPEMLAQQIRNAGSVFLGHYTPESVGDYASGTNHTLPTNGYARAYSGLNMDAFVKKITFQQLSQEGLQVLGPQVEEMAMAEQLDAHARAVSIRLSK